MPSLARVPHLWPFAAAAGGNTDAGIVRAHRTLGRWFRTLLTPWNYFDIPKMASKAAQPLPGAAPGATLGGTAGDTAGGTADNTQSDRPTVPPG